MTAVVKVFAADAARSAEHLSALARLRIPAAGGDWVDRHADPPEFALVDVSLLDGNALGDFRREAPGCRLIVSVDAEALETAGPLLALRDVAFLSLPCGDADYALALAALEFAPQVLASAGDGDSGYALRLAALGEEIARIARAIEPPVEMDGAPAVPDAPLLFDPAVIRRVLKARRLRDSLFTAGTFADPAWDMLLDLAAARGEGKPVSVSSLAIAAAAPTTTALRYMKAMIEAGLLIRRADPDDRRRTYIDLSEDAFSRMRAWVAGAAKAV